MSRRLIHLFLVILMVNVVMFIRIIVLALVCGDGEFVSVCNGGEAELCS